MAVRHGKTEGILYALTVFREITQSAESAILRRKALVWRFFVLKVGRSSYILGAEGMDTYDGGLIMVIFFVLLAVFIFTIV